MNDFVVDTLVWAALAAVSIGIITALFAWRPWARGRSPEQHPAE